MDGSRRSNHGNAYFTGFGSTKRIVFFDTLLARLDGAEIEAVLAHELGHFKRHHVIKRIAWTFGVSLLFLWCLGYLMQQPWFYQGLGVSYYSRAVHRDRTVAVLPDNACVYVPVSAGRQPVFQKARVRGRRVCGA